MQLEKWGCDFWGHKCLVPDRETQDEELEAITLALQAWRPIEDETLPEEDRVRWSNVRRNLLHDLGLTVVATP